MTETDRKHLNKTAKHNGWTQVTTTPHSDTVHFARAGDNSVTAGGELATFYFENDRMTWAFVQRPSGRMIGDYACNDSVTTTDALEAARLLARPSIIDVRGMNP